MHQFESNYLRTLIIICVLFINSCSTVEGFEKHYGTWIGGSLKELKNAWGDAQIINELSNGNIEYGYNLSKSKKKILPNTCILYFEVNNIEKIIRIRHEGNRCHRAPSFS